MSEAQLWDKVRKGLTEAADFDIDLMRVENMVMAGVPDVNYCHKGVEGWIELKHVNAPPVRDNTPVFGSSGLRDEQVVWLHKRAKRKGNCWILGRCGAHIFLVHGSHAKNFNQLNYLQLIEVCAWCSTQRKVDWVELLRVLIEEGE